MGCSSVALLISEDGTGTIWRISDRGAAARNATHAVCAGSGSFGSKAINAMMPATLNTAP